MLLNCMENILNRHFHKKPIIYTTCAQNTKYLLKIFQKKKYTHIRIRYSQYR